MTENVKICLKNAYFSDLFGQNMKNSEPKILKFCVELDITIKDFYTKFQDPMWKFKRLIRLRLSVVLASSQHPSVLILIYSGFFNFSDLISTSILFTTFGSTCC